MKTCTPKDLEYIETDPYWIQYSFKIKPENKPANGWYKIIHYDKKIEYLYFANGIIHREDGVSSIQEFEGKIEFHYCINGVSYEFNSSPIEWEESLSEIKRLINEPKCHMYLDKWCDENNDPYNGWHKMFLPNGFGKRAYGHFVNGKLHNESGFSEITERSDGHIIFSYHLYGECIKQNISPQEWKEMVPELKMQRILNK